MQKGFACHCIVTESRQLALHGSSHATHSTHTLRDSYHLRPLPNGGVQPAPSAACTLGLPCGNGDLLGSGIRSRCLRPRRAFAMTSTTDPCTSVRGARSENSDRDRLERVLPRIGDPQQSGPRERREQCHRAHEHDRSSPEVPTSWTRSRRAHPPVSSGADATATRRRDPGLGPFRNGQARCASRQRSRPHHDSRYRVESRFHTARSTRAISGDRKSAPVCSRSTLSTRHNFFAPNACTASPFRLQPPDLPSRVRQLPTP